MRILRYIAIIALGIAVFFTLAPNVSALSGNEFQPNRIIDDSIFFNGSAMNAPEIQNFLNAKVPVCDTNGTQPYAGTTRAIYGATQGYPAPFICLKNYSQAIPSKSADTYCSGVVIAGTKSAAQIIYDVAQACGISPKVLLVLLQKEQSLVTDDWPWSIQYRSATGYGCPDTAACDSTYYGFFNQVYNAARQYQRYAIQPTLFNYAVGRTSFVSYQANAPSCGGTNIAMQNNATAGLYNYTPYQPNAAALANLYGTGDACSAYGNRNFWRMYNDWFGSTYAFVYMGVDYFAVFDPVYYLNNYSDLKAAFGENQIAAFNHFISNGIREGRVASPKFDINSYRNRYPDLRWKFGKNLLAYYLHYITNGLSEGRVATGSVLLQPVTMYGGIDYKDVYDFTTYSVLASNPDISRIYSNDDPGALGHFINFGMSEGRLAKGAFNITSYRYANADLRLAFGTNLKKYYIHYINIGKTEGRITTGNYLDGTTSINNINYRAVYSFDYYENNNSNIKNAFGLNDAAALQHFIDYGMSEGRLASANFNVRTYKNRYPDLQAAFGTNLKKYYLHYMYNGLTEGRSGI